MNAAASIRYFQALGLKLERVGQTGQPVWRLSGDTRPYETTYFCSLADLWRIWRNLAHRILIEHEVGRRAALADEVTEEERAHLRAWAERRPVPYPKVLDDLSSTVFETWPLPKRWRTALLQVVDSGVHLNFGSNATYFLSQCLHV